MSLGTDFTTHLPQTPPKVFEKPEQQEQLRQLYNAIEILRQQIGSLIGSSGETQSGSSPQIFYGAGSPGSAIGVSDDFYLNLTDSTWWKKAGSNWYSLGNEFEFPDSLPEIFIDPGVIPAYPAVAFTILSGSIYKMQVNVP